MTLTACRRFHPGLVVLAALLTSACGGDPSSGPAPDPAGTITSAIRINGQGADLIDFDTGAVTIAHVSGVPELFLDANLNFVAVVNYAPQIPRRLAAVGAVDGLGEVTAVPTAGWVTTSAALAGHGYVLEDNGKHWRFYVTSYTTAAGGGGVIGVTIKWAAL